MLHIIGWWLLVITGFAVDIEKNPVHGFTLLDYPESLTRMREVWVDRLNGSVEIRDIDAKETHVVWTGKLNKASIEVLFGLVVEEAMDVLLGKESERGYASTPHPQLRIMYPGRTVTVEYTSQSNLNLCNTRMGRMLAIIENARREGSE